MPFQSGMRVVITNESAHDIANVFYEVDYTLGDPFTEGTLYFHAFYNREHATKLLEDYTILPLVPGKRPIPRHGDDRTRQPGFTGAGGARAR